MRRQVRATDDRVWVRAINEETTTPGGLVLPGGATGKAVLGCVAEVGPGRRCDNGKRAAPDVRVGDVVAFEPKSAVQVLIDGQEFRVLRESDVLGVVG